MFKNKPKTTTSQVFKNAWILVLVLLEAALRLVVRVVKAASDFFSLQGLQKQTRLEIRSSFFSQWMVNQWNRFPQSVVTAESTNPFKNRRDKQWGCRPVIDSTFYPDGCPGHSGQFWFEQQIIQSFTTGHYPTFSNSTLSKVFDQQINYPKFSKSKSSKIVKVFKQHII